MSSSGFDGAIFHVVEEAGADGAVIPAVHARLVRPDGSGLRALLHSMAAATELASPPGAEWEVKIDVREPAVLGAMTLALKTREQSEVDLALRCLQQLVVVMDAELNGPMTAEERGVMERLKGEIPSGQASPL